VGDRGCAKKIETRRLDKHTKSAFNDSPVLFLPKIMLNITYLIHLSAWLLQGIFAFGAQRPIVSVEFLSRVVDVLDWGSRIWQNVPRDDRGCIFDWSFIRGVKRLQIQAVHSVSISNSVLCQIITAFFRPSTRDKIVLTQKKIWLNCVAIS
jgi:hypothetical protein